MPRYSTEQQAQIIKMKSEGKTSRKIAEELGLSKSGVNDFYNRLLPIVFAEEHKASFEIYVSKRKVDNGMEHPLLVNSKAKAWKDMQNWYKETVLEKDPTIKGQSFDYIVEDDLKYEASQNKLMKIATSPLRTGNKTHMYIPDSQVKPDISFEYLRCKGEYIVEKKPDVIIFGGDFADMPSLSSYDKGKGKAEGKRVKKDIEAAIKGMQTLLKPLYDFQQKQLREFGFIRYKPRMLITLGNHEDRINRYTNDNPELIDFISAESLKYKEQGLEVYNYLEPVLVDGVTYIHYLPNEFTGKPQGGTALKILADFGGSITQGHKQILTVATRFAPATGQQTWYLQAGSCYDHNEEYKGLYNNNHFRGLFMKYNLDGKGNYDLRTVSLKYIMDKYQK